MYLELEGKSANSLEENMYLKKEIELVMKKYNYLKDKNVFLNSELQMAKRNMAGAAERRGDQSNHAGISTSATATPPIFLYNHPSLAPFFCPVVVAYSDLFNSQYIPNPEGMTPTWEKSCSKQGRNFPGGISTKKGTPLFLLSVPWMLPFLTQLNTLESHPGISRQNDSSQIHQCCTSTSSIAHVQEDNHQLLSKRNTRADASRRGTWRSIDEDHEFPLPETSEGHGGDRGTDREEGTDETKAPPRP